MKRQHVTTVLEVLGVACLAGFAFLLFSPAALAVVGAALLLAAWRLS